MNTNTIEFTVNGTSVSIEEKPGEMLSDLLRYRLGLTGTKIGCNEAECGSCTVIVDGEPVLSCTYPAAKVRGSEVITIEGLEELGTTASGHLSADTVGASHAATIGPTVAASGKAAVGERTEPERLHPLQDAFIKYGAVQCGFCMPGQLMTSYALIEHNPDPSDEEIKHALKDTLCRCAAYPTIIKAVQAAAQAMRTGHSVEGPTDIPTSAVAHRAVGTIQARADGVDKVTGRARFTDDLTFEGMLHARVKRAMVPAAVLKSLDVSRARALPGVVSVLTATDIPGSHTHGVVFSDWPVLVGVGEKVRTVGDAIAIVAAESREIATDALDLIEMEFEALPVVTDPVQAAGADAPAIHEGGNLLQHIKVRKGDTQDGFAGADVILEHTFHTPTYDHAFIEPECSVARRTPEGRMEVYVGSQIPYEDREQVAASLGVEESKVRIIGQLVGGGFGGKEDIAGQIHAALLANATGRPVKLLFDRNESLLVHPKRHATQIRIKVGATKNGRLTAFETELYGDTGAYASLGDKVMTRATTHSSGPYEVPNVKADCYAMYTNNPPAGAFRGFGVLQSAFAVESAMDMLAERLGMGPVELRRINALREGSTTNTGQVLRDSVGLLECIEKVEAEIVRLSGPKPFEAKIDPSAPHLRTAWGIAVAYKNTGLGGGAPDRAGAEAELLSDGTVEVRSSSAELGQGLPTSLQLIAAEELGVSPDQIRVLLSDTDLTPDGGPTTASRQTYVTGNAVRKAAEGLRDQIVRELAAQSEAPAEAIAFEEGRVRVEGRCLTLAEVAAELVRRGKSLRFATVYDAPATKPLGEGGDMHFGFSFAAQGVEIEVNTRTGEVKVLRLVSAVDVGAAINPLGLRGQMEGGAMMGIGHALTERFIVEDGQVITDRLARYRMPSITMTPEIIPIVVEHPISTGPFGGKGVGEIVSIPTSPAVTNALYNAVGVRLDRIPIDQEDVLAKIRKVGQPTTSPSE